MSLRKGSEAFFYFKGQSIMSLQRGEQSLLPGVDLGSAQEDVAFGGHFEGQAKFGKEVMLL